MDKKLTKSNNKMIAGVCAGFAEYFGWEVTIVRILYAFLTISGIAAVHCDEHRDAAGRMLLMRMSDVFY